MNQPVPASRATRDTKAVPLLKIAAGWKRRAYSNGANGLSPANMLAAGLAFLAAWLLVNRQLFRQGMIEAGDAATIILQVHNAQRFRELLGNYSRWRFHHPGPGFIYILALGDWGFRKVLHFVPGPLNSAALTLLVLYTCFLFTTIWIFQQHCDSTLFLPAAVALSLWFIYVVDATFPGSASGQLWMPYILLFCFLLFLTACASVATGNARHLPIAAVCGMLLIEGHVAQILFVGLLSVSALGCWTVSAVPREGMRSFLSRNRTPLLASAAIVVIFLVPIVLDMLFTHPNNLQNIRVYMREHPGAQNSWLTSLKYTSSFVAFIVDPEVVLKNPAAHLLSRGGSRPYVVCYWGMVLILVGILAGIRLSKRVAVPRFQKYVVFEIALTGILVTFWARKIAGGLFSFNAYFIFSTFLLGTFVLVSLILTWMPPTGVCRGGVVVACVLPLVMLGAPHQFEAVQYQLGEVGIIASHIPRDDQVVRIVFPEPMDWPVAAGVASQLDVAHREFCVSSDWSFMFGLNHVCGRVQGLENLELVRKPAACTSPCNTIYTRGDLTALLRPSLERRLPFTISTDDPSALAINFYDPEGEHGPMWSQRKSEIRFVLANDWQPTPVVQVRLTGVALPGRPAELTLNGHRLGTVDGSGPVSAEFHVDSSVFRSGAENRLEFVVDKAGPVGDDPRMLGFKLNEIEVMAAPTPDHNQKTSGNIGTAAEATAR